VVVVVVVVVVMVVLRTLPASLLWQTDGYQVH